MEILNTYSEYSDILALFGLLTAMGVIMSLFIVFVNLIFRQWKRSIVSFIVAIVCAGLFLGFSELAMRTETVYHEVTVSDYNKIDYEKYKIVEHRGKIVVLKEIE